MEPCIEAVGCPIALADFREQVFFSTVRIVSPSPYPSGTGFLYQHFYDDTNHSTLLVSNRHVLMSSEQPVELMFHDSYTDNNGKRWPAMGSTHKLAGNLGMVIGHPDPKMDLACVNITDFFVTNVDKVFYRTIGRELVCDAATDYLYAGQEVCFVGYPHLTHDAKNNLPLLRRGHIASIPMLDFDGTPHVIIDAGVYPGSSGSPVFVQVNGAYKLLGVIDQTLVKHEQVQEIATAANWFGVQQVIGLGLVLKARALLELMEVVQQTYSPEIKEKKTN